MSLLLSILFGFLVVILSSYIVLLYEKRDYKEDEKVDNTWMKDWNTGGHVKKGDFNKNYLSKKGKW
jgi:hypothetical protein